MTCLPSFSHFGIQSVVLRTQCRGHLRWLQATLSVSPCDRHRTCAALISGQDFLILQSDKVAESFMSFHPHGFERNTDGRTDLRLELSSYDDLSCWACATYHVKELADAHRNPGTNFSEETVPVLLHFLETEPLFVQVKDHLPHF